MPKKYFADGRMTAENIIERNLIEKDSCPGAPQHVFLGVGTKRIREFISYSRDVVEKRNNFRQLFGLNEKSD